MGPNSDFDSHETGCARTLGSLYVTHVPPIKGKTTACFVFLQNHVPGKALGFSPSPSQWRTYVDGILSPLKVRSSEADDLVRRWRRAHSILISGWTRMKRQNLLVPASQRRPRDGNPKLHVCSIDVVNISNLPDLGQKIFIVEKSPEIK